MSNTKQKTSAEIAYTGRVIAQCLGRELMAAKSLLASTSRGNNQLRAFLTFRRAKMPMQHTELIKTNMAV